MADLQEAGVDWLSTRTDSKWEQEETAMFNVQNIQMNIKICTGRKF